MDKEEIYCELHNDLFGRANVMIRQTINNQIVVIYDDHRWLLNVLFAASKYIERPILITFDAHDDAARCEKYSKLLKNIGVSKLSDASAKQFGAFVEYDQKIDDGGWLTTAMELDLVNHVVNIGNRYGDNISDFNGCYTSEIGVKHKVFELSSNLDSELGCRGKLGDTCKENEFRDLRDLFGIEHYYSDIHNINIREPYVLDFDLDFFTLSGEKEPTHGWTERVFKSKFPQNSDQDKFLKKLIKDAHIITICREPDYCGSIGDSNRILSMLDRFYFGNRLGTDVTL